MTTQADQALSVLEDLASLFKKTQINLKKCPKERLSKPGYLQSRIQTIEEYWVAFKKAHNDLLRSTTREQRGVIPYYVNEEFLLHEDLYLCMLGDLRDMLASCTSKTTDQPSCSNMSCDGKLRAKVSLPNIQLPPFSGNYEEWPTFKDLYVSLIHECTTLSEVEKLHYLKTSISGEAASLLKHVQVTGANYVQAWETLNHRYDNRRIIVNNLMKRLFYQKKCTNQTAAQLKALLDCTTEVINSLKNIKVPTDSWDPVIIFLVVQKLDPESHKDWEQTAYSANTQELPTWKELREFLEAKFRTLELIQPVTNKDRIIKERSYHTANVVKDKSCALCSEKHTLCHCKEFIKMDLTQRNNYVKEKQLCFNCLLPGHLVYKCKVPVTCRVCRRRHHSLLHKSEKSNDTSETELIQPSTSQQEANKEAITTLHVGIGVSGKALLATALVKAKGKDGHATLLRVLVDQGSQASFISEKATQTLKLQRKSIEGTVTGVGSMQAPIKHVVQLNILSRRKPEFNMHVEAYVMSKQLTTRIPHHTMAVHNWQHLEGLDLADPEYNNPGPIDLLLGVKEYARIVEQELIKGPPGSPCAQKTTLGWILFGEINTTQKEHSFLVMHHQVDVDNMLKTLWEIDTNTRRNNTKEEQLCEDIYHKTYSRNEQGRFIVKLPFKTNCIQSTEGNTRDIAKTRLIQLERRFKKQPKLKEEYEKVIEDYKNLGHIEEVPEKEIYSRKSVYLPHHPVLREEKETTKTRIVFDASCKGTNGISLNDELLPGPVLQEDLRCIIMRWRMHAICFAADIQKMYRMVMIYKEDADFQRILWRNDSNDEIKDYRLLTVTFGTTSAPYLAVKTLIQLAHEERENYPVAADITLSDFYVDDVMSGCDTVEEAIEASNQLKAMLSKGSFELKKWSSNKIELMKSMDQSNISSSIQLDINLDGTVKALGIAWNLGTDQFTYKISLSTPPSTVTKRNVLSDVQKLYDPLGWISPSIVLAKMLIQKLWLVGTQWDQPLSEELTSDWLNIRRDFEDVNQIFLDRWLHSYSCNIKAIQLHGFSDASTRAYAGVVYCRVEQQDGTVSTNLIASRTKVAPLKTISLPRLELCGALLLSRLLKQVILAMRIPLDQTYCWTDSTIVLAWLHGEPQKWKTFVANRVVEIKDNTNNTQWHHVVSQENPADIASRGMFLTDLKKEKMWWKGPEWLSKREINLRKSENTETDLELKLTSTLTIRNRENEEKPIWERFSSLTRMKRVLAYCQRLLRNKNKEKYLTTGEMNTILQSCIKYYQQTVYERDIEYIKKNGKVRKSSALISLTPFLDKNNLLRVGGRLQNANLPVTTKHPIIIPSNQHITTLLINEAHKQTLHGGIQVMMTYLRSNYWIINLKSAVRKCIRSCKVCIINKGKINNQLMGELPAVRVRPQRAFLNSGVDYAGPVLLRTSKGRGHHATKGYICLFVCMATRAIHLEAVTDLTSQAFLAAFRRFVARRGQCTHLFSDNGTNFVGAAKELKDLFKAGEKSISKEISEHLATNGTTWHFIPPRMPNCGGLWEAGVQSAKRHLARVSKDTKLTYEEMATLLTQIEACLNSRPLCQLDNTVETMSPLTPGHFLIGEPLLSVPDDDYEKSNINLLTRWQLVQQMTQDFWRRWHSEYLNTLQQRTKWQSAIQSPTVGDIVVIKEENLPPTRWLMGKIKTLHPGKDNLVRVVTVQCKGQGELKRPVTKLIFLPKDE